MVPSEEQIDFVIDALENIPSEKFENDVVRIAVALYGSKDKIEEIVGFGERDIEDIKCRLYGHDGKNNCDMSIFKIWFSNTSYKSLKGKTFFVPLWEQEFRLENQNSAKSALWPKWSIPSYEMGCRLWHLWGFFYCELSGINSLKFSTERNAHKRRGLKKINFSGENGLTAIPRQHQSPEV